jgi:hypothetical protein
MSHDVTIMTYTHHIDKRHESTGLLPSVPIIELVSLPYVETLWGTHLTVERMSFRTATI